MNENEIHIRQFDDGIWRVDCYDNARATNALADIGATVVDRGYDADSFDCTPRQLAEFVAVLGGVNVEFPKRKRPALSDAERKRRSDRMKALRGAKKGALTV